MWTSDAAACCTYSVSTPGTLGPENQRKHEDPTAQNFWNPTYSGLVNLNVASSCLCSLLGPYSQRAWDASPFSSKSLVAVQEFQLSYHSMDIE